MKDPIDMNEAEIRARFDFSKATRGRFAERCRNWHSVTLLDQDPHADLSITPSKRDSQLTEIAGKHLLISWLISAGFEVAEPIRDNGIDLIACSTSKDGRRFVAHPIQLKASSTDCFSLDRKYADLNGLVIPYIWRVEDPNETSIYALTFDEAVSVLNQRGYSKTDSWKRDGYYFVRKASAELKVALQPFLMTPERWKLQLQSV